MRITFGWAPLLPKRRATPMAEAAAWLIILFPFIAVLAHTIKGFIDERRELG
jgi:hypothetical protein